MVESKMNYRCLFFSCFFSLSFQLFSETHHHTIDLGFLEESHKSNFECELLLSNKEDLKLDKPKSGCSCLTLQLIPKDELKVGEKIKLKGSIDTYKRDANVSETIYIFSKGKQTRESHSFIVRLTGKVREDIVLTPDFYPYTTLDLESSGVETYKLKLDSKRNGLSLLSCSNNLKISVKKESEFAYSLAIRPDASKVGDYKGEFVLGGRDYSKKFNYSWNVKHPLLLTGSIIEGVLLAGEENKLIFKLKNEKGIKVESVNFTDNRIKINSFSTIEKEECLITLVSYVSDKTHFKTDSYLNVSFDTQEGLVKTAIPFSGVFYEK